MAGVDCDLPVSWHRQPRILLSTRPAGNDQFLHYLLRSDPYSPVWPHSKGVRINQWDLEHEALRTIPVLLPDLTTQRQIADFLDRETARIDLLIEKKQRMVERLGEKERGIRDNADLALSVAP